jgi:hypothetical protein
MGVSSLVYKIKPSLPSFDEVSLHRRVGDDEEEWKMDFRIPSKAL